MVACRPNWVSLRAASVTSGAPSRLTGNERVCCAIRQRTRGPQRKVTRAKCTGNNNDNNNEKALRETQTLRAGCSKAERKVFVPPQTPSRGAGRPKFNGHYLHLQTQFGEDRCTQFRVTVVTDPQTNKPTDRTDYNTLRR